MESSVITPDGIKTYTEIINSEGYKKFKTEPLGFNLSFAERMIVMSQYGALGSSYFHKEEEIQTVRLYNLKLWKETKKIKVVSKSSGGCTGINDYILSNGTVITCKPSELKKKLEEINK